MPEPTPFSGRRFVHVAAFLLLAAGLVVAVRDGGLGWFVLLALIGGAIVYRRQHGPLHDDHGQIGGRSVLVERP